MCKCNVSFTTQLSLNIPYILLCCLIMCIWPFWPHKKRETKGVCLWAGVWFDLSDVTWAEIISYAEGGNENRQRTTTTARNRDAKCVLVLITADPSCTHFYSLFPHVCLHHVFVCTCACVSASAYGTLAHQLISSSISHSALCASDHCHHRLSCTPYRLLSAVNPSFSIISDQLQDSSMQIPPVNPLKPLLWCLLLGPVASALWQW